MKKISILLLLFFFMISFTTSQSDIFVTPVFDGTYGESLPKNFRTTKDSFLVSSDSYVIDDGLHRLTASGSGQFSEPSLLGIIHKVGRSNLIIVDLRQESHGLINGRAVSWSDGKHNWSNVNKTLHEIEKDERHRLHQAVEVGSLIINAMTDPYELQVYTAQTEKEFVEGLGLGYIRIPVADHCRPSDQAVDQFVEFIKKLPEDKWLHFHCRAGRGRTTTFLTLYDMMLNAKNVDLESILARHLLLGGADLLKEHDPNHYKYYPARERLEFVKKFYDYCSQLPDFSTPWSSWVKQQPADENR